MPPNPLDSPLEGVEHVVAPAAISGANSDDRLDAAEGRELLEVRDTDSIKHVSEDLADVEKVSQVTQSSISMVRISESRGDLGSAFIPRSEGPLE